MRDGTTTQGFCRTCEYNLSGLPEAVCPECGRTFDPADPSTYLSTPDALRRRRRNRWIKRVAVVLVIGGLLYVLIPRRVLRGDMTFTCADCGYKVRIERSEPQAVPWLPFRFPGSVQLKPISAVGQPARQNCDHHYSATIAFDLAIGGKATSSAGAGDQNEEIFFVGSTADRDKLHFTADGPRGASDFHLDASEPATPENAGEILRMLMGPENRGIMAMSTSYSVTVTPFGEQAPETTRRARGGVVHEKAP